MTITYVLIAIIAIIAIIYLSRGYREGFTIAKRDGLLCRPLLNKDAQTNIEVDHSTPGAAVLVIEGYNYVTPPKIYRDGLLIVPLDYQWDAQSMAYYFTVAAPDGVCNHRWMIETHDFVKPVVTNALPNEVMNVSLERRRYGFNRWAVKC